MPTIAEVRAQYPQYQDMSDNDLAGALHKKFYSDMPTDQFAEKIGLKPDKYQQAAIDEQAQLKTAGIDEGAGYTRRLAHGATLGADSTLVAAAMTPLEMFKRGINPKEAYNYAKAREDQIMGDARKNTGVLGTVAEVLGGGVTGARLAQGGLTAARSLAPDAGLLARSGASAIDGAGFGAFSGGMEGNGLQERATNALKGAALGGVLGGVVPPALAVGGAAISPVVSNIRAMANPQKFAQSQVARAVSESGMTPQQISESVLAASRDGQGMFTTADAMGNSGQRMLASTMRAPGEARTSGVNFLEARQADQGRRVSNALAEGFDAPQTGAQTEARLATARDNNANAQYDAVRQNAGAVDVLPAIRHIDETLGPAADQMLTHTGSAAANDSVEAALIGFRNRLSRTNPDDFASIQRIRGDMADAAQNAQQNGYGNRARLIRGAVGRLDASMESASSGFRQANRDFAQASRNIEAVDTGRTAATRGRTEDTIPAYRALRGEGQAAFRAGYVDPLIGQTQGAAVGVNKARPFTSDAFRDETAAIAPMRTQTQMVNRIARENTMFQTRNASMGNSKTIENAADDAAMGVDPHMIGQVLSGNWGGALRSVIATGSNALSGNTPAVRQAVSEMLLTRGTNMNPAAFQRMLDETVQRIQQVQQMARSMGRGAAGGLAVAGPGQNKR
jgi:hypothetical protein